MNGKGSQAGGGRGKGAWGKGITVHPDPTASGGGKGKGKGSPRGKGTRRHPYLIPPTIATAVLKETVAASMKGFEDLYNAGKFEDCGKCYAPDCEVTVNGGTEKGGFGDPVFPTSMHGRIVFSKSWMFP